ncbi:MAG TPA: GH25 family lysozyme [Planctomycetota bacterium]|nr:GH25 family lysozyme [Planctomycetota bacterium]
MGGIALADSLGSRVLRFGDSGPDVAELQEDLRLAGCDPDEPDGRFSPKTERAVRSFQEQAGLPVTGIVDAATASALAGLPNTSPGPTQTQEELAPPPPGWIRGIDVSRYDVNVDWAAVKSSGITFGIARAADGLTADPFFARNWAFMQATGVLRGASQYFRASQDPIQQADFAASQVGALGSGDFPLFLEVETLDGMSPAQVAAGVAAWVARVEAKTGQPPILGTKKSFWQSLGNPAHSGCALWVKDQGSAAPSLPAGFSDWKFWQYSTAGSLPGINGSVDLDYYHGSRSSLNSLAHASWPETQAPPPPAPGALDPLGPTGQPLNETSPTQATQPPVMSPPQIPQQLPQTGAPTAPASMGSPSGGMPMPTGGSATPSGGGQSAAPSGGSAGGGSGDSPSNTLGVAPALDGMTTSGNPGPLKSYNGQIPPQIRDVLAKALAADGLPASWLDSNGLKQILAHESSFNPNAKNPTSTAFGLFQFLNSTWRTVGAQKTSDPYGQAVAGLKYIQQRYGNPDQAWAFWQAHHWY